VTIPTFAELTTLDRVGAGHYRRELDHTYFGSRAQFGGYSMGLCLEAMIVEVGDPNLRPRVFSQQFGGPVQAGPCDIQVSIERAGKRTAQASARISTHNGQCGTAMASFVVDRNAPSFDDLSQPDVAPIQPGEEAKAVLFVDVPIHSRYDFFPRFSTGEAAPSEDGGWVRVKEPTAWGPSFLLHLSDLWPPPTLQIPDRVGRMLSFEHLASFDTVGGGLESCGPFLIRVRSGRLVSGISDEDIEVWNESGHLLLRARQHRLYV
jgi:acyl-CoA thioesterase